MKKTVYVIEVQPFNGYLESSKKMPDGRMKLQFTSDITEAYRHTSLTEAKISAKMLNYFVKNQRFTGISTNIPKSGK